VTFDDYRALPGVNFSTMKAMDESPLHYRDAVKFAKEATSFMNVGTAGHCMILEPDQFPPRYVVWTGGRRAGKEWDAFEAANLDKTIIKSDEYDLCKAMRDAVMEHPSAGPIFAQGEAEKVLQWRDPETGLDLKCRIDWLAGSIVDLKTSKSANPRQFGATAARYKYHAQMAFYRWAVECATGLADWPVHIVVVESARPFDVVVYALDLVTLEAGMETCRGWLRRIAECKASGKWPGRYEAEATLNLPNWAFDSDDDAADELGITINGKAA
jgi:hypothetical protein